MKLSTPSFFSAALFQLSTTNADTATLQSMMTTPDEAVVFSGSCCYGHLGGGRVNGKTLFQVDGSSPGISCDYGEAPRFSAYLTSLVGECPSYAYRCPTDGSDFCGVSRYSREEEDEEQRRALQILRRSTDTNLWMDDAIPYCDWDGVTCCNKADCDKHDILHVEFCNCDFVPQVRPIPSEIGSLVHLRSLILGNGYLWNNTLTGTIPSEIGLLENLEELNLSQNKLTGTIPSEIGFLDNLVFLGLSGNKLTGTIPSEIGSLKYLEGLDLSNNKLTGTIPPKIWDLQPPPSLCMGENAFDKGFIPDEACTNYKCTNSWDEKGDLILTDFLEVCQEGEGEEKSVADEGAAKEEATEEEMEVNGSAGFAVGFRALIWVMLLVEAVLL